MGKPESQSATKGSENGSRASLTSASGDAANQLCRTTHGDRAIDRAHLGRLTRHHARRYSWRFLRVGWTLAAGYTGDVASARGTKYWHRLARLVWGSHRRWTRGKCCYGCTGRTGIGSLVDRTCLARQGFAALICAAATLVSGSTRTRQHSL